MVYVTYPTVDDVYDDPTFDPASAHNLIPASSDPSLAPIFGDADLTPEAFRSRIAEAISAWLLRSPSRDTRVNYALDLKQFLAFVNVPHSDLDRLTTILPHHVSAWRDAMKERGLENASVRRKLTTVRSLFSYLQRYGYCGGNPAHSDFVSAPAVPRDGKTVAFDPKDCRRLLDAPDVETPVGVRDRAIFSVLAYSGCRVGELVRLRVKDYKQAGGHHVLEIRGKGGKERRVPLHPEAFERIETWLDRAGLRLEMDGPIFRPVATARGNGFDGFLPQALTRRGVQYLVERYARSLGLDPAVSVHSFRVTALTTARERGCEIIDLQDFAGHADPRTTLTYIRNRERLSKSPAYVLGY